jgi:hypothetical protein
LFCCGLASWFFTLFCTFYPVSQELFLGLGALHFWCENHCPSNSLYNI